MDIDSEPVQKDTASTSDGPRRSSRQARPTNQLSMSTGGSARRPSSLTQPTTQPRPWTDLIEDSVQEDLPAITINQWKPTDSQSKVKRDRPRRCTFCRSRRKKCVPQGPDSCQACLQHGLECRDWREVLKENKQQERQKGQGRGNKSTRGPRSSTRPSAPQIKEALLQSFRAGPSAVRTSRKSLNFSDQPHDDVSWEADKQYATEATTCLDLSQRHADTSHADASHADTFHSRIRRVSFNTPSGRHIFSSPEVAEVDADAEMETTQNTPAERAPSFEIMTEAEYRASLKSQQHSSGMTFKKEPADNSDNLGLRVDNVGCFLQSLGLDHCISNFHDVGLKSREHLKKLVNRVNDRERMDELRNLLQSQKVPITDWWVIHEGLSKVAANHYL
ncbi:hypothetical protein H2248_001175 [Termitomyces sp. 'cryptogamus']|nr:hypothetical protein H2248_001175 [Termitomyces sp. 'cryptogamus']